jgi:hypothetical protein
MVTSGAVALGRQRVSNEIITKALKNGQEKPSIAKVPFNSCLCKEYMLELVFKTNFNSLFVNFKGIFG